MIKSSLEPSSLTQYVSQQLETFFPDGPINRTDVGRHIGPALERLAYSLSRQRNRHLVKDGEARFNHLNTDQYAAFLYFLSNTVFRENGDIALASKVFALNKALHSLDVFYEIELPEVFAFQHPVGTVLGRANYGNYFRVYQHCLVGVGADESRPSLGEGVVLYGGSSVIGKCNVGSNVFVGAGSLLLDLDVPANSTVYGRPPSVVIKPTTRDVIGEFFSR